MGFQLLSQAKTDGVRPNLIMCRCLTGNILDIIRNIILTAMIISVTFTSVILFSYQKQSTDVPLFLVFILIILLTIIIMDALMLSW